MMVNQQAFDIMVEVLKKNSDVSIFVRSEVLVDMRILPHELEKETGRKFRQRRILVKGSDGLPLEEVEFEFLPTEGNP